MCINNCVNTYASKSNADGNLNSTYSQLNIEILQGLIDHIIHHLICRMSAKHLHSPVLERHARCPS